MNEEVNIKVTQATQEDEINRLKNELAEASKTIRELSAQLGQAKQSTDIISVIKNIARQECMEMITEEVAETVDTRLQNNLSDYWDISDHEDDIAEVVSNVLDSEDIPSAHDLEYNLDMLNYENEIKAIAREVIEQTEFDVSVK
jgi:hypothetical protein|tara:strand:- start:820 stop:1251 length:432 start_codon:yes stop_codon:yes gene_type:complete